MQGKLMERFKPNKSAKVQELTIVQLVIFVKKLIRILL